MKNLYLAIIFGLVLATTAMAQRSTGGAFTFEQTVLAGGGASNGTGSNFKVEGTIGQAGAGIKGTGAGIASHHGFWTPPVFVPTSASVKISGQVLFGDKQGIGGVTVILEGGILSAPRTTRTNSFGNFEFEDVDVGQFYIVSVQHKKYGFAQNTQSFTVFEDVDDVVFRADWQY